LNKQQIRLGVRGSLPSPLPAARKPNIGYDQPRGNESLQIHAARPSGRVGNTQYLFSSANAFNDPFEFLSDSRIIENADWQHKMMEESVRQLWSEQPIPKLYSIEEIRASVHFRVPHLLPQLKAMASELLHRGRDPFRVLLSPPRYPRTRLTPSYFGLTIPRTTRAS